MERPSRYWTFFALSLLRVGAITGLETTSSPGLGDLILQGLGSSQNASSLTTTSGSVVPSSVSAPYRNTSIATTTLTSGSQTSSKTSTTPFESPLLSSTTTAEGEASSTSVHSSLTGSHHNSSQLTTTSSLTLSANHGTNYTNSTTTKNHPKVTVISATSDAPTNTETTTSWATTVQPALMSHAQSCWSAYSSYRVIDDECSSKGAKCTTKKFYATYTDSTSSTFYPTGNISTYTLCDGYTRADYNPITTTISSITSDVHRYSYPTGSPAPNVCFPNVDDCAVYYWGSNLPNISDALVNRDWLYAACGNPLEPGLGCHLQGNRAKVLYFPPETKGGDLCHPSNMTITSAAKPAVVTTLGTEFTQGTAYLSLDTLFAGYLEAYAPGHEAVTVGPNFKNIILPFAPEEMSTNCYQDQRYIDGEGFGPGTQINFADWNFPHPASAYWCQNQCIQWEKFGDDSDGGSETIVYHTPKKCRTIYDDFHPLVALPSKILEMAPEWSSCNLYNSREPNFVYDPPTALQVQSAPAQVTVPGQVSPTTAASPSPTAPPQSGPTALPDTKSTSNAQDDPASQSSSKASDSQSTSKSQASDPKTETSEDSPKFTFDPVSSSEQPSPKPVIQSSASQLDPATPSNPAQVSGSSQSPAPAVTVSFTPAPIDPTTPTVISIGPIKITEVASAPRSTSAQQAVITIGSTTLHATLLGTTAVVVGDSTVSVGSTATVGGAVISAQTGGVVVQSPAVTPAAVTLPNGNVVSATMLQENVAVVDGTTISAGGAAVTVSGEVISMASGALIVGSSTFAAQPAAHTFNVGGETVTASFVSGSNVAVVDGTTLSLGGSAIKLNGETLTLASGGLVAGGTTLHPAIQTLTIGSDIITESYVMGSNVAVIGSKTLTVGGSAVTIDGEVVSLASTGLVEVSASGSAKKTSSSGPSTTKPTSHSGTSSAPPAVMTQTKNDASTRSMSCLAMLMVVFAVFCIA